MELTLVLIAEGLDLAGEAGRDGEGALAALVEFEDLLAIALGPGRLLLRRHELIIEVPLIRLFDQQIGCFLAQCPQLHSRRVVDSPLALLFPLPPPLLLLFCHGPLQSACQETGLHCLVMLRRKGPFQMHLQQRLTLLPFPRTGLLFLSQHVGVLESILER